MTFCDMAETWQVLSTRRASKARVSIHVWTTTTAGGLGTIVSLDLHVFLVASLLSMTQRLRRGVEGGKGGVI